MKQIVLWPASIFCGCWATKTGSQCVLSLSLYSTLLFIHVSCFYCIGQMIAFFVLT